MKKIIRSVYAAWAVTLLAVSVAQATVNVESMRKDDKKTGLNNALSFHLGYMAGNTEVMNMTTKFRSDYVTDLYRSFLAASLQRGEKSDARYMNRGFVHLRGMKPLNEAYTAEGFLQKQYDDFTLLEDRELVGGGIRIRLIDRKAGNGSDSSSRLHAGVGLMREKEIINLPPHKRSHVTRSTNYLSGHWQRDDRVTFAGTLYYQPRLSRSADYRILFDGGLSFKINQTLSFTLDVDYRYDSEPPPGVKDYDIEITNGISINF